MMFVLGLTGPSGAGKSRVAAVLASHGFAVLDADRAARSVTEPGSACLGELAEAFGAQIILPDGSLDRKKLAAAAFTDETAVGRLNAITHPHIMAKFKGELEELEAAGCKKAVLDAPALFEAGAESLCGRVAAVVATSELRLERILRRDGITPAEAARRLGAQKPLGFYMERADFIIENNGSEAELISAAEGLARSLCKTVRN
jgi:dephospho-CoA kinase